jgi:hypothetical protein
VLRLKVVSDGHPGTTLVLDADTGEEVHFDAHMTCDLEGAPGRVGSARLVLVFSGVPVEAAPAAAGPFALTGHARGALPGVPPPAPAAPAAHAAAPAPHAGAAQGHAAHNARLNQAARAGR